VPQRKPLGVFSLRSPRVLSDSALILLVADDNMDLFFKNTLVPSLRKSLLPEEEGPHVSFINVGSDIFFDGGTAFSDHFDKPVSRSRGNFESKMDELPKVSIVALARRMVPQRTDKFLRTPGGNPLGRG